MSLLSVLSLWPPFGASESEPVPDDVTRPDFRRATCDVHPLEVVAGATRSFLITFRDSAGEPIEGATVANALAVSFWSGEDLAAITPGLTAEWATDGEDGVVRLTVPEDSTIGLAAGSYSCLIEMSIGSDRHAGFLDQIDVFSRPGSEPGPYTLCSYRQMLPLYPSVRNLHVEEADLAGFARQRARATAEFLRMVIERYDPKPGMNTRRTTTYDPSHGFERQDMTTDPPTRSAIRAALVAGGLVLDEPDGATVAEIVGLLAVAEVLERQPGDARGPYGADAVTFRDRAVAKLETFRPHVDLDDDGVADVQIGRDCTFLGNP